MDIIEPHDKAFSSLEGTSFCYKPMPKDQLISKLKEMNLWGSAPSLLNALICSKPLFNDKNIGCLYERMEKLQKAHPGGSANV